MACSVKICGITNPEDALMVSGCGADYLGVLVNVDQSPRSVRPATAGRIRAASTVPVIILTYDHEIDEVAALIDELCPAGVQLAGNETAAYVKQLRRKVTCEIWKSLHVPAGRSVRINTSSLLEKIDLYSQVGVDKIVLDSVSVEQERVLKGGTGQITNWKAAKKVKQGAKTFLFLAGGISPQNVSDAIVQVEPDGVDLSSGVEVSVGKKDQQLVKDLITNVRKVIITY